jgi:DNA-directed RNA polymerase specialized sigma24 family protein
VWSRCGLRIVADCDNDSRISRYPVGSEGNIAVVKPVKLERSIQHVEPFVVRVVERTLRSRNIVLSIHRREDLTAYVLSELWVASSKFDAGRYKSFRQFADAVAQRRVVDWIRADRGRSRWSFGPNANHAHAGGVYERERPQVLSLDFDGGSGEGGLDPPDPRGEEDFEGGGIDLRRVLAG